MLVVSQQIALVCSFTWNNTPNPTSRIISISIPSWYQVNMSMKNRLTSADMPVEEREIFLAEACEYDPELLSEARQMLAHDARSGEVPVETRRTRSIRGRLISLKRYPITLSEKEVGSEGWGLSIRQKI